MENKKFYVYELVETPVRRICYIGKGSGKRMYRHKQLLDEHIKKPRRSNTALYRQLNQLLDSGKGFFPRKVFETNDENEALAEEERRIREIGLDNLFNIQYKSVGLKASDISAATRKAMSEAQLGKKQSAETCAKRSKSLKAYRDKMEAEHGMRHSPEAIQKAWKQRHKRQAESGLTEKEIRNRDRLIAHGKSLKGSEFIKDRCAKMRAAVKPENRKRSEESKQRSSKALLLSSKVNQKSGYRGVGWHKTDQVWKARLKGKYVGRSKDVKEAARKYDDAFEKLMGLRPNCT